MADAAPPPTERSLEVDGNRLTMLPDGPGLLEALIGLIDGAERSLRLLYYTYTDDCSGRRVTRASSGRGRGRRRR